MNCFDRKGGTSSWFPSVMRSPGLGLRQGQKNAMQPGIAERGAASPGPRKMWGKAPRISRLRDSNTKAGMHSGAQKERKREKRDHESGEDDSDSTCLWELLLQPRQFRHVPACHAASRLPSCHLLPSAWARASLPIKRPWCGSLHPSRDPQNLPELAPGSLQPHPLTVPPST